MIYKKYELSLSQNGESIMHIARNSAGIVIFRAETLEDVKEMIDVSIAAQEKMEREKEELKLKKEAEKEKRKNRGLFQAPVEEVVTEETSEDSVLTPPQPEKRITRGADGKFISKSALSQEEEKKKTFWDKLTS
jgi:hypothetical protein